MQVTSLFVEVADSQPQLASVRHGMLPGAMLPGALVSTAGWGLVAVWLPGALLSVAGWAVGCMWAVQSACALKGACARAAIGSSLAGMQSVVSTQLHRLGAVARRRGMGCRIVGFGTQQVRVVAAAWASGRVRRRGAAGIARAFLIIREVPLSVLPCAGSAFLDADQVHV